MAQVRVAVEGSSAASGAAGPWASIGAAPRGSTDGHYARLANAVALTDVLAVVAATVMATALHDGRGGWRGWPAAVAEVLLVVPVFAAFGLYRFPRLAPVDEVRRCTGAVSTIVTVALIVGLGRQPRGGAAQATVGVAWALGLVLVLGTRQGWHVWMGRLRARGRLNYRTLLLGRGTGAARMAEALADREHGYDLLGVIDRPGEDLGARLDSDGIECLFVDPSDLGAEAVGRVTRMARSRGVDVTVCAYLEGTMHTRLGIRSVGDMLALSTPRTSLSGLQRLVKRGFDLAGGAILLVVTAPLWALAAVAVGATSAGPVLFRQTRVGRDGRPFRILKFRTMVQGADGRLAELRDRNEFAGGVLFKIRDDPRVTRVGRVLRRLSLDELPQLINVLRGDMSLVGPRPALPGEVALYEDWHRERLVVRPGLTGLWQVSGRSESCFDEYVRLDLYYVENWSLTLDLYVVAKTIPALIRARGAY